MGLYFTLLFVLAWLSRRTAALASLALCAGAILSRLWADQATPFIADMGVQLVAPPLASVVTVVMVLAPGLLVLAKSAKTNKISQRICSSLVFAVLGVMLTYGAFANAIVLDEASAPLALQILSYERWIITVAILLALFEVIVRHKPKHSLEDKKR